MCRDILNNAQAGTVEMAAPPPRPEKANVQTLQDRGALFAEYVHSLDHHFERWINRVDENGEYVREPPTYQLMAWSAAEGWDVVDLIVKQWNTAPSDSLMRTGTAAPLCPGSRPKDWPRGTT